MAEAASAVTTLLRAWRRGDQAAFERLTPLVYDQLRRRARHYLRGERPNHTLRPTALVHEAYLRLVNLNQVDWQDRSHFFALAARQMRRILVDSARARRYHKRGGGAVSVTFDEALAAPAGSGLRRARRRPRAARSARRTEGSGRRTAIFRSISFTSFTSGEGELFRIPSRGGSPEQLTSDISAWEYTGSVSPDGTTLLFWKTLPSQSDLMTMPIEPRGSPVPFTDSPSVGETSPTFSPDGRWVAYDSNESGSREVHVRPFPGPGEGFRVSPHGGAGPAWSRDGREIVYQRRQEIWAVAVQPGSTFRHANPRMLFKPDPLSGNLSGSLAAGEGTTRFLAIRREQLKPIAQQLVYAPNWVEELAHVRSSR